MRAVAGLWASAHALLALLLWATILVALHRLGWIARGAAMGVGAAGLACALGYVLLRARAIAPMRAAQLADRRLRLSDRLSTALSFLAEPQRSALMEAAIADA